LPLPAISFEITEAFSLMRILNSRQCMHRARRKRLSKGTIGMSWRFSRDVRQQLFPAERANDAEVTDRDYVDFVRQFRRSKLVAMIAAVAPDFSFNQADYSVNTQVTPWGLAEVARVSLTLGSERNRLTPTAADLHACLLMYNRLGHPGLKEHQSGVAANTLLQLAFSQFPFQRPPGVAAGRSIALFKQTQPADRSRIEVLRGDWETELLGCSLEDYVGVSHLLMAAAKPNNGQFNPAWLEMSGREDITAIFNPTITRQVLRDHLVADAESFRRRDTELPGIGRRFTFNPLVETPVVSGLAPDLLMPIPDYVLWKPTPSGLYFTGLRHWNEAFSRDLGELFQAYVGRHLNLISGVEVHPEIVYGKNRARSVDWIVIFPNLVLMVEAKSARPTQALRSGAQGAAAALQKAFNKANNQLETTFDLIVARVPEFAHIPVDRPIVGIIVTLEDFHLANSPLHVPMYSASNKLPTMAVSVDELEGIVCLGGATEAFLHEHVRTAHRRQTNLREALSRHKIPANPILAAGIDASPITRVKDLAGESGT
jgi:hypothetical protein